MCRGIRRISKAWIVNHLTVTLVRKFHRRKHNRRAINKFFQSQEYYHRLGNSVGIIFDLSFRKKSPSYLSEQLSKKKLILILIHPTVTLILILIVNHCAIQ